MLKRVKENFEQGIARIKWFAGLLSERLHIEIAVIRLLYQSDEMNKKREELLRTIGQRVYDMKKANEKNMQKDQTIIDALANIDQLEKHADELKRKAAEISSVGV